MASRQARGFFCKNPQKNLCVPQGSQRLKFAIFESSDDPCMPARARLQLYMIMRSAGKNTFLSERLRPYVRALTAHTLRISTRLCDVPAITLALHALRLFHHACLLFHRLFPRSYPRHQYEIGILCLRRFNQTHFVLFQFTFYHTIAAR